MLTLYTHKALLTSFSFHTMSIIIFHIMEMEIYQTFCDIMLEYCNVYYLLGVVCAKGSNWRQYENDRIEWHTPYGYEFAYQIIFSEVNGEDLGYVIHCIHLESCLFSRSLDFNTFMSAPLLILRSTRKWKFWFDGNFCLTMGYGATHCVAEFKYILICSSNEC